MVDGGLAGAGERRGRWWRSPPVVGAVSVVVVAGVGLGIWSGTGRDSASSGPAGGGWHSVTLPQAAGANSSGLYGVTALPDGTAWAVGYTDTSSSQQHTAVQRWDGQRWVAVPTPRLSGDSGQLNDVSASSADDAWAVGVTAATPAAKGVPGSGYQNGSLIEHWDGTRWTPLAASEQPRLPGPLADLQAVAATGATSAWAVGWDSGKALIEHFDGARWSVSPNPAVLPGKNGSWLLDVAAVSAADVWAVGENAAAPKDSCLIEHWDGGAWKAVACPAPAEARMARLLAVTEISPEDLWAVGYYATGTGSSQIAHPLIEHFDGTGWSTVPTPATTTGSGPAPKYGDQFAAVAGRSATDVYAATPNGVLVHWDGKRWTLSSDRFPGTVYGMAARADGSIWAVGEKSGAFPTPVIAENPSSR